MKRLGECEDVEVGIWVEATSRLHHVDVKYDTSMHINTFYCDKDSLLVHIPRVPGWAHEMRCIHSKGGACCGGRDFVWAQKEQQQKQPPPQQQQQARPLEQQQQPRQQQPQWQQQQARRPPAAVAAVRRRR
jgi:hypothetical protein